MRWFVVAVALCAPVAWAEPPVPNPPPTPSEMEFPQAPPENPRPTRGVPRAGFFAVAGATVAFAIFAGIMTGVAQSEAHQAGQSIFQTSADQLSDQAQAESLLATGGWLCTALLAVATLLVGMVTRWHD